MSISKRNNFSMVKNKRNTTRKGLLGMLYRHFINSGRNEPDYLQNPSKTVKSKEWISEQIRKVITYNLDNRLKYYYNDDRIYVLSKKIYEKCKNKPFTGIEYKYGKCVNELIHENISNLRKIEKIINEVIKKIDDNTNINLSFNSNTRRIRRTIRNKVIKLTDYNELIEYIMQKLKDSDYKLKDEILEKKIKILLSLRLYSNSKNKSISLNSPNV